MDILWDEQILALLRAAYEHDRRDWLALAVAFIYALRASEVVGLTAANVVGVHLVRKRGKGSKAVRRELHEDANPVLNVRQALIALASRRSKNQRLFPICTRTLQRKVHKYGKLAGLPDLLCHPHTLKHSILSISLDRGMSLREVQEISGHKRIESLEKYLHARPGQIEGKFADVLSQMKG